MNSQLTKARDSLQKADIKGGDVILGKISEGGEKKQHLGYNWHLKHVSPYQSRRNPCKLKISVILYSLDQPGFQRG